MRTASTGNPERRELQAGALRLQPPGGGTLTVTRTAKGDDSRSVRFDLVMVLQDGQVLRDLQVAYVSRHDTDFNGRSTLGYSDIDLGRLVSHAPGPALHLVIARTAAELKVESVGVVGVVNPGFGGCLTEIGMTDVSTDTYEASPEALENGCALWLARNGWLFLDA